MAHLTIGPIPDVLKERLEAAANKIARPVAFYVRTALDDRTAADLDVEPLGIPMIHIKGPSGSAVPAKAAS